MRRIQVELRGKPRRGEGGPNGYLFHFQASLVSGTKAGLREPRLLLLPTTAPKFHSDNLCCADAKGLAKGVPRPLYVQEPMGAKIPSLYARTGEVCLEDRMLSLKFPAYKCSSRKHGHTTRRLAADLVATHVAEWITRDGKIAPVSLSVDAIRMIKHAALQAGSFEARQ